jgi:pilus assembly protein Flp/PilA
MKNLFARFMKEDEGQDLIEYALLAALIAIASIATMNALAGGISSKFGTINSTLGTAS